MEGLHRLSRNKPNNLAGTVLRWLYTSHRSSAVEARGAASLIGRAGETFRSGRKATATFPTAAGGRPRRCHCHHSGRRPGGGDIAPSLPSAFRAPAGWCGLEGAGGPRTTYCMLRRRLGSGNGPARSYAPAVSARRRDDRPLVERHRERACRPPR